METCKTQVQQGYTMVIGEPNLEEKVNRTECGVLLGANRVRGAHVVRLFVLLEGSRG
jgi:hypothetical protein